MFKRKNVWWTKIRHKGRVYQKSLETENKALARNIEAKIRADIVEGKYFDKPIAENKTFADLAIKYLAECTIKKSFHSQERDKGIFKNHLIPCFGKMLVVDITPKHISSYKSKRISKEVSADTINKELGLMKASFNVAIREWEWLDSNPVSKVRMEKPSKGRVRFLSEDEFGVLYNACEDWLKPIVMVAKLTGLRQGNLLELQWKQIDLSHKTIFVEDTKNGDSLGLPICEDLLIILIALKKVQAVHTDLVFHNPDGSKINRNWLYKRFIGACNKAGIEDFRWHDLRHCFASKLVQNGVDLFRVQKLLGHKDGRITQRYAHLAPENLRSAVNVLNGCNFPSKEKVGYNLATLGNLKNSKSL